MTRVTVDDPDYTAPFRGTARRAPSGSCH